MVNKDLIWAIDQVVKIGKIQFPEHLVFLFKVPELL